MPKQFTRIEPTTTYSVGEKFKRQVVVKRYRTEDGLEHEFTMFGTEGRHGAGVIALTPDYEVVVARQFRPNHDRYVDDLPGGMVEAGEDDEAAAHRELFEETGYKAGEMQYLGKHSGGASDNFVAKYYLATNCTKAADPEQDTYETEQGMEVALISIQQLIENARTDSMCDPVAVFLAEEKLKRFMELARHGE